MKPIKLIGSLQEKEYRDQLSNACVSNFNSGTLAQLKQVLIEQNFDPANALLVGHTPDQEEDLYTVLIWSDTILHAEIHRFDSNIKPIVEIESLKRDTLGKSQINQIKIAVAMEILKQNTEQDVSPNPNTPF